MVTLMEKQKIGRKHKFVSSCLAAGKNILRVWPQKGENMTIFAQSVEKISQDPRVKEVKAVNLPDKGEVFEFYIEVPKA
jgi:hypothetical protein